MTEEYSYIERLTPEHEEKIKKIPFLNIDAYIIPTPFIRDKELEKDYKHSYVWSNEGEILGYFLVYSSQNDKVFHIYKQVTSPFGRGKGIGSAFIEKLISEIPEDATVYLYIWEKQLDSIDFFESRGFILQNKTVFRKLTFCYMVANAANIQQRIVAGKERSRTKAEELGKIRHDARKNLQLMLDMINMLSIDNSNKIIEDINRETTALVNLLNDYGDKIEAHHAIDLKEILIERIIPFIESSDVPCEIKLHLEASIPGVIAHYVDVGRALVNLVSNSLDAIREKGIKGVIEIKLNTDKEHVILEIKDNGLGIPGDRLQKGNDGVPLFVGKTTKVTRAGEGYGTRQIFSTFGVNNIDVVAEEGVFTKWVILLQKNIEKPTKLLSELESRYNELISYPKTTAISKCSFDSEIAAFVWQTRRMEILCYDLIFQFSKYNNIRDIYRSILACRYGGKEHRLLKEELNQCRIEHQPIKKWLIDIIERIIQNEYLIRKFVSFEKYAGSLFKSYGQAVGYTIIFTMDPSTGHFFATDRKLAEHLDFVNYLKKDRDLLLRGEINGDLNDLSNPILLGVWSVSDANDLMAKLELIQQGAITLIKIGVSPKKRLAFYNTTYNRYSKEIDSFKTTTLEEMARLTHNELGQFIVASDDELTGFTFVD